MDIQDNNNSTALNEKLARIIDLEVARVSDCWFKALRQKWGEKADQKITLIEKNKKEKNDLLSLLLKLLSYETVIEEIDLEKIFCKIRTEEYSISDFFFEVSCLEKSLGENLKCSSEIEKTELQDGMKLIHNNLSDLFGKVLDETSAMYEYVAEMGRCGFCQLDNKGRIVFTNREINRLFGPEPIIGKPLVTFFESYESIEQDIQDILSGKPQGEPFIRRLQLKSGKTVNVEIDHLIINGQNKGEYAYISDISHAVGTEMTVFENSPIGIAKANKNRLITYANQTMCNICGVETLQGKTINDLFDERNFEIVKSQLSKRFKGGLSSVSEYEIEITRLSDGKHVPVMITGVPERDLGGNIIGTLAIIRSIELRKAAKEMHKHIETIRDEKRLLKEAAKITNGLIPFDLFIVVTYSSDEKHQRTLFSYPEEILKGKVRWQEISPYIADCVNLKEIFTDKDKPKLLDQPQWQEFGSFIGYQIIKEGRAVASLFLLTKGKDTFNKNKEQYEKCQEYFEALPLDKAVLMALSYEKEKDLEFRLNLIKKISSASNNIKKIADLIVEKLHEHYNWQNVSIFKVNEERQVIQLISQKADSDEFLLPKNYEQYIKKGVLGYVYQKKEEVNIGNVYMDHKFKDVYVELSQKTLSELCLPIIMEGKVIWLLNMEDSKQNAFSKNDEDALRGVINELQSLLERARLQHFLKSILESASDAVIITDSTGNVKKANPAVKKVLGYSQKEIIGRTFKDYFIDTDIAELFLKTEGNPSDEIILCHKDQDTINVLLSSSQLPEEFEGRVFIAKDLTLHKRVEELQFLEKMYNELATQTKTPLSLVFSWLRRLKSKTVSDAAIEIIEKTIKQLHKVELTYDRLAFYNKEKGIAPYHEILLDISEVVDRVVNEFPKTEKETIDIVYVDKPIPYIYGDIFQLSFCFETILSYLLRFAPIEEKIRLSISHERDWITVNIRGFFPAPPKRVSDDTIRQSSISKTLTEMALGERIIETLIDKHGGKYCKQDKEGGKIEFQLNLPVTTEGD